MNPFGYSANAWVATASGTTANRGMVYQTFTAPGSGTVKVKGQLDFSAIADGGTNWSTSWVRMDIYNSTNTNHEANLVCEQYTSNQGMHTATPGIAELNGGTVYTVRITVGAYSQSNKKTITTTIDNVVISTAPVSLSASTVAGSTNASLAWTASSANNNAPGFDTVTPYKVYRSASTPVTISNYIGYATSDSYADSSTSGNTLYYYAVTNVDANGVESPLSAEASVLTRPGVPGTPSYSNIQFTSLTVSWAAPAGGASSYTVERCVNAGCSNFSQVANGITQTSYNDSGLSIGTPYRYRVYATNASGNGAYSVDSPVTTNATISVTLTSDGLVNYAVMPAGTMKSTIDLSDTQAAKNDGNVTETFNIKTSDPSGGTAWTLAASPGINQYVHEFSVDGGSVWNAFTASDTYATLATGMVPNASQSFDLRITVPTSTGDYQEKSINVTIQAVQE